MRIHEWRARLDGVKGGDKQFTARCPAHDDRENSLSVSEGDTGKIVLNCFAGCKTEAVVSALGLSMRDLFNDEPRRELSRQTYEYHDTSGTLLYRKTRMDYSDAEKSCYFTKPDGTKGAKGVRRVPYNLPGVVAASVVYFVEGEKCADAVIAAGRTATTLDTGAKSKWLPEYTAYFAGKDVIVLPDNDDAGEEYAQRVAQNISGAKIIRIPGLPKKGDIYDWLEAGHTMEELDALPAQDAPPAAPEEPRVTQGEILLKLVAQTGADFFHSDTGDLYATLPVAGHTEIWPLGGKDFATWLSGLYYRHVTRPINTEAIGQAVSVLSARAQFDSPEAIPLHTRTAERDGALWYDLTNPAWQAVRITEEGWRIEDAPPILFNRYRHQVAQVMPQPGGDIRKILRFINMKEQHTLFLCWLVSCFVPGFPHVMPIFYGEKGAAKSSACELLKSLLDPSSLETLTIQNEPRALLVNLQQHWFLPFDNVSHINEDTSDTLCRAITGGGIQQRKLYTNAEDTIFNFQRCLAVNGINNAATRPDLLDRSILIELERIGEEARTPKADLLAAFEADKPAILGGILDTLAAAIEKRPGVSLSRLPRMADFALWGYAIGEALGGLGETFLQEYSENREKQNAEVINSDPVASLVVAFMRTRTEWDGTISELYTRITAIADEHNIKTKGKGFPPNPAQLGKRLNGIKSNLEGVGVVVEKNRTKYASALSLKMSNLPTLPTLPTPPSDTNALRGVGKKPVPTPTYTLPTPEKPLYTNESVGSVGSVGKIGKLGEVSRHVKIKAT